MASNALPFLLFILGIYQIQAKTIKQSRDNFLEFHRSLEYFHRLDNYTKGLDYMNFAPIFQTYFLSVYGRLSIDDPLEHFNKDSFWDRKACLPFEADRRCPGKVINCQIRGNHDGYTICLADESSTARYTAVGSHSDQFIMKNCPASKLHVLSNHYGYGAMGCSYKQCTCLNENTDNFRHFSLRETTSDIYRNRVVTGMRIEPNGYVFHLSIQEGEISNGRIINNEWKHVNPVKDRFNPILNSDRVKEDRDYVTVTYKKNQICLQEFDLTGSGLLLTGMRFKEVSNAIYFQIRVTPYDIKTHQLEVNKSHWLEKSPKIDCKKFEKSEDKYDGGQSVIPNIDIQPVIPPNAVPLSGAGLAFDNKNFTSYGGIIYGKLFISDMFKTIYE